MMIARPTSAPEEKEQSNPRSVYRPPGANAPKVVNKPKAKVGGFGTKQPRQLGTSFEQATKAEVDGRIEKVRLIFSQTKEIFF